MTAVEPDEGHAYGGVLEGAAETLLALFERLFSPFLLGDVVDNTYHLLWIPLLVEVNLGLAVNDAHLAVRAY